ncbi:hypothetical protein AYX15_01600 [Cryptococcus neoformans]|nr:hypothetical protein AYX15_01600 [Cryptococcus neoformans var. grubii]
MDNVWTTNGFVGVPDLIEDPPHDSFSLPSIPPNQAQSQPYHSQSNFPYQPHVYPYSLRTQRSTSSLSGWSTVTSDTNTASEFDDDASTMSTLPSSISPQSLLNGFQNHSSQCSLQRVSSLSIDPKLFASIEKDGKADEETLETAKPRELTRTEVPPVVSESSKEKVENCKKKVSHARKQTADHIPRPRNAFILFRKHVVDAKLIPPSVEMRHQNVSIITAKMWSEAPAEQKAHFNELARIEKEEHMKKYPGYRYQPVYRRTNVVRRRVRKDEAEEEKCKNVAELLMKGKSGQQLEEEIKEKVANDDTKGAKKNKALSRRASGACELSKGALRALRAQARQRQQSFNSGDWSDLSRSTSMDRDVQGSRRRQSSAFESTRSSQSPEPANRFEYVLTQGQNQVPIRQMQYMAYSHQGLAPWSGDILAEPNEKQAFTFTSTQQGFQPDQRSPPTVPTATHTYPLTSRHFLYPQPQPQFQVTIMPDQQAFNEFYVHDAALPFSPSAGQFAFQSQSSSMHTDDMPTFNIGNAQQQVVHPPMSARWDKGHLLPPSSDVPLEGLPFDDGLVLEDFKAALAHADDMVGGVW